jgi:hypothetical protein
MFFGYPPSPYSGAEALAPAPDADMEDELVYNEVLRITNLRAWLLQKGPR